MRDRSRRMAPSPHSRIGMEGTERSAAIIAIVARFNVVSEGSATASDRYGPIFERTDKWNRPGKSLVHGVSRCHATPLCRLATAPRSEPDRARAPVAHPAPLHDTDGHLMLGPVRPDQKGKSSPGRLSRHPGGRPRDPQNWMPQRAQVRLTQRQVWGSCSRERFSPTKRVTPLASSGISLHKQP